MGLSQRSAVGWGEHSLSFRLPTARLLLRGLSAGQRDTLSQCYPEFVGGVSADPEYDTGRRRPGRNLECRAYRLGDTPQVSPDALTRDGQYTPLKMRTPRAIELIGINFEASISTEVDSGCSFLGVAREYELAQADVIDNFLRVYSAHQALARGGVILHSAGVVFGGEAYIFVGRSGAGKTTLTRKAHAEGGLVLSDDINLLLPRSAGFHAFAVPFAGEFGRTLHQVGGAPSYPAAALVLLEQGDQLRVGEVRASQAVARLLVGSPFVNMGTDESSALFDVLTDLVRHIPVMTVQCTKADPVSDIIAAVMKQIDKTESVRDH